MLFVSLVSLPQAVIFAVIFISLLGAWLSYSILRKTKLVFFFTLIVVFFCGAFLLSSAEKQYKKNPLFNFDNSSYVDFYGSLYKSPVKGKDLLFLYLRVDRIQAQGRTFKITGNLVVSIPQNNQDRLSLEIHDQIKISAKTSPIDNFQNFNSRSSAKYYQSLNIHKKAHSKSFLLIEKINSKKAFSILKVIAAIRTNLQTNIENYFEQSDHILSQTGTIIEALLLGNRQRLDHSTTRILQTSGLFHLFAISGAHIVIISYVLFLLFKMVRIPSRASYLILIFVLIFFTLLVEGRPSVFRASLMASLFLLGKFIWKDVSLLNTLSLSAFFLLVHNPFNLYSLGFQLTFAATLSIILFYPKILKYTPKLPFKISEILALSLAAQIGVLPLILISFNRVTLFSFFLNCAAVPLVGIIMTMGYIFLGLTFIYPAAAGILASGLDGLVKLFLFIAHIPSYAGFLSYRIPTPHSITVVMYYFLLLLILIPEKIKRQKLILTTAFLITLIILITFPFSSKSDLLKVTFIDVGQGDAILIEYPGKAKMLIDGGGFPNSDFDIGERVVSPFLWKKGIKRINYLVLTHAHPDHFYGLHSVVKNFKIKEFWEAYSPQNDHKYKDLKASFSPATIHRRVFTSIQETINDVSVDVLYPKKENFMVHSAHNRQSVVIRIAYKSQAFLFTGDIETDCEEKIINSGQVLKSQILKSPHHGSRTSSSWTFLNAVSPDIVVISVGRNNIYQLPHNEVLERYKQLKLRVFRTDVHGAVEIATDGEKIKIRTAVSSK
ncbi:MAG: DNA internalization-related competence protein ComEC/Rec2 [Candidatus Aminicenantes bacterium]|nr:DNA internalization-related competence protein ComEC/Rec2 [Candidatus Aminicenantes bacterium]